MFNSYVAAALFVGAASSACHAKTTAFSASPGGDPFIEVTDRGGVVYALLFGPNCTELAPYTGAFLGKFRFNHGDPGILVITNDPDLGNGYIVQYLLDYEAQTFGIWIESTSAGITFQEVNTGNLYKVKACK